MHIEELQGYIYQWAQGIMPNRVPADAIKKLSMEEVPELWRALKENGHIDEGEIADILILALDICAMSCIDAGEAIKKKMAINEARNWKFEYGVLQHEDESLARELAELEADKK